MSDVVPSFVGDSQNSNVFPSTVEDSESIQSDIMDQSLNPDELAVAMSRNTVHPAGEEVKRVGARLHNLHAIPVIVRTERLRIG